MPDSPLSVLKSSDARLPGPAAPNPFHRAPSTRFWLFMMAICIASFGAGWLYGNSSLAPQSAVRDRSSLRFADQAVRDAFNGRWRDAYIAASRARHADSFLPGLEVIIGQMLYDAGNPVGAAGLAHAARQRGEKSPASALLLGLEAWHLRSAAPSTPCRARAEWLTNFWLEQALRDSPGSAAPHFFLAELERLSGRARGFSMERALHRFFPWESAWILEAKMQLAAAESKGVYNAGELRDNTRLDDSPQALAIRALQSENSARAEPDVTLRRFSAVFALLHQRLLLSDPALSLTERPPAFSLTQP